MSDNKSLTDRILNTKDNLNLSEAECMDLLENSVVVSFAKKDIIIKQGNYSNNVAYLNSGLVKIQIEGPYYVQVVRILKPSNYIGLNTFFGNKVNQFTVIAIEDSEVCFIEMSFFNKLMETNPGFSSHIVAELAKSEIQSYQNCVRRTQKLLRGKLADVLLDFADNIYYSDKFPLLINQEDIGNLVDASRESVSRVLGEFVRDGILSITGKQVEILNKQMLKTISVKG